MSRSKSQGGQGMPSILKRDVRDNIDYYLMMLVPLILIFIFSYLPMFGLIISFQDYSAGKPFLGAGVKWVGLKHFSKFINSYYFTRIPVSYTHLRAHET